MQGTSKPRGAAALCCLLVLVLMSAQQHQVAAMSKFCRCYKQCYAECRKTSAPYPCNFGCIQSCINGQPPPSTPKSAADCNNNICLIPICGVMQTDVVAPGDTQACLAECAKNIGTRRPKSIN